RVVSCLDSEVGLRCPYFVPHLPEPTRLAKSRGNRGYERMGMTKMGNRNAWEHRTMRASVLATGLLVAGLALSTTGCRITDDDVDLWARKTNGPTKLIAVLQHDKYELPLRIHAGMTLVSMKPRGGRAVGLLGDGESYIGLLEGLQELSVE